MRQLGALLRRATRRSLVIVDEAACATEPAQGAALARAAREHLAALGCAALFITHGTEPAGEPDPPPPS